MRIDPLEFDAIFFDMDGTLVESESIWFAAEREVARRLGAEIPQHAAGLMHGVQPAAIPGLLRERFGLVLDAEAYLEHVTRAVLERVGSAQDRAGAADLVRRAVALEKVRAIVSNSSRDVVAATLSDRPWANELPRRFSVDDVSRGKPHPDLYLHAASELSVSPERCLVIEDSVTGVTAAVRAGTTCVAVTFGHDPAPFLAHTPHVVERLADVERLLTPSSSPGPDAAR